MAKRPTRFERDLQALHGEVVMPSPRERAVYVEREPEIKRVLRTPLRDLRGAERAAKVSAWVLYAILGSIIGLVLALLTTVVWYLARHHLR